LYQLFPDGLHMASDDYQHILRLRQVRLRLEFSVHVGLLFRYGAPNLIVYSVQIWRVWRLLIPLNKSGTLRLQHVLRDVRWGTILLEDKAGCLG